MDVREKYVMQKVNRKEKSICQNCIHHNLCIAENNQPCFECNRFMDANGVTVKEWVSVDDRFPEKEGQYLIFTTQYFTTDHIDEIDHKDGIEISGYCKRYGFLSKNGIHAKYWRDIPQPPKGE